MSEHFPPIEPNTQAGFAPCFPVTTMSAALEHYKTLGFDVMAYEEGAEWAWVRFGNAEIHLHLKEDRLVRESVRAPGQRVLRPVKPTLTRQRPEVCLSAARTERFRSRLGAQMTDSHEVRSHQDGRPNDRIVQIALQDDDLALRLAAARTDAAPLRAKDRSVPSATTSLPKRPLKRRSPPFTGCPRGTPSAPCA